MPSISSVLSALRLSNKRPRPSPAAPSLIEPMEPRLLLAGDLVSEPTGILPIGAAGYTLNSAPDERFSSVPVALFADSQTSSTVKNFTATIDWGDGTADTAGRIIRNTNDSTFYVLGTHRYTTAGQFNTTVTINHTDGRTATTSGLAFISDNTFNATTDFPGTDNPNGVWTYGSSPEGFVPYGDQLSDVVIGWGEFDEGENEPNFLYNPTSDIVTFAGVTYRPGQLAFTPGEFGEPSILLFTAPADGLYHFTALFRGIEDASAGLEISALGTEYLNTTVTGSGVNSTQFMAAPVQLGAGQSIFFTVTPGPDQSNVDDTLFLDVRVTEISQLPTLFGAGAALSGEAGRAIKSQVVGTFFDSTGQSDQTDFTARIRWGDGTTSDGNVTATANGGFQVVGSHTYKDQGNYEVRVILRHTDGRRADAIGVAVIEGGRTFTARGVNIIAIEGLRTAGVRVATFNDSRNNADPGDFTALISWGDDSTSEGRIVEPTPGRFVVRGRHTYPFSGANSVSVTIVDNNDNTLQTTSTASVVDAPTLALTDRVRFTTDRDSAGRVVFSFIDVNPFASAQGYSATIDWGDGSKPSGATLQSPARARFDVLSGTHAYASPGTYTIRITLVENDRIAATYRVRAVVRDPATSPQT